MISVICHTNIDDGRGKEWPTKMACRPQIGDAVRARGGYQLEICSITHAMRQVWLSDQALVDEPYLIVELTKKMREM